MRTSFHHQSEAQPPNGPLTAATSPDTPSPSSTTQSHVRGDFPAFDEKPRIYGRACWCFVSASGQLKFQLRFSDCLGEVKRLPTRRVLS